MPVPLRVGHRRIGLGRANPKDSRNRIPTGQEARSEVVGPCRPSYSHPMESSSPSSSSSSSSPSAPPRLTVTQLEQHKVEAKVFEIYRILHGVGPPTLSLMLELWRDKHIEYLTSGLGQLGPNYHVLDANRPWLCYWIIHSFALLGESLDPELEDSVVDFLSLCQDKDGGYSGGPGQFVGWSISGPVHTGRSASKTLMPHVATTYAAVNTLVTLGSEKALLSINRQNLLKFLLRMKDSSGAFRMHDRGEIDVRACYTAISVASLLNVLNVDLVKDLGSYILSCQTYEGGISGEPGSEAHGGYTFCGLATMILINEAYKLDLLGLIDWVASRQGVECGFQGRVNKLVDGCYSFWQGGTLALAQRFLPILCKQMQSSFVGLKASMGLTCYSDSCDFTTDEAGIDEELAREGTSHSEIEGELSDFGFSYMERNTEYGPLFHSVGLQQYILLCSQVLEGGFKDKPGKQRDFYHTCYCLSGLSVSQHSWSRDVGVAPLMNAVLGPYTNLLEPVHPLYNVVLDKYYKSHEFFSDLGSCRDL